MEIITIIKDITLIIMDVAIIILLVKDMRDRKNGK